MGGDSEKALSLGEYLRFFYLIFSKRNEGELLWIFLGF
jgi:hypothetical protein